MYDVKCGFVLFAMNVLHALASIQTQHMIITLYTW